jgi:hypothetical protein
VLLLLYVLYGEVWDLALGSRPIFYEDVASIPTDTDLGQRRGLIGSKFKQISKTQNRMFDAVDVVCQHRVPTNGDLCIWILMCICLRLQSGRATEGFKEGGREREREWAARMHNRS